MGSDIFVSGNESTELFGGYFETYSCNTGDTTERIFINPETLNIGTNVFTLTVSNSSGCEGEDDIALILEAPDYAVQAPNTGNENNSETEGVYNSTPVTGGKSASSGSNTSAPVFNLSQFRV